MIAHGGDRDLGAERARPGARPRPRSSASPHAGFLRALLATPEVRSGAMDTGLIDRLGEARPRPRRTEAVAAAWRARRPRRPGRARGLTTRARTDGWRALAAARAALASAAARGGRAARAGRRSTDRAPDDDRRLDCAGSGDDHHRRRAARVEPTRTTSRTSRSARRAALARGAAVRPLRAGGRGRRRGGRARSRRRCRARSCEVRVGRRDGRRRARCWS